MKRYVCVATNDYKEIPKILKEYLDDGWVVHSYQVTNISMTAKVAHYLLLEKEDSEQRNPTIRERL